MDILDDSIKASLVVDPYTTHVSSSILEGFTIVGESEKSEENQPIDYEALLEPREYLFNLCGISRGQRLSFPFDKESQTKYIQMPDTDINIRQPDAQGNVHETRYGLQFRFEKFCESLMYATKRDDGKGIVRFTYIFNGRQGKQGEIKILLTEEDYYKMVNVCAIMSGALSTALFVHNYIGIEEDYSPRLLERTNMYKILYDRYLGKGKESQSLSA